MTSNLTATGCPALPFRPVADELLAQMGPHPRALMERYNEAAPLMRSPEYSVIEQHLGWERVCTSLRGDDLAERAASMPSGTSGGWIRHGEPTSCPTAPDTHWHVVLVPGINW